VQAQQQPIIVLVGLPLTFSTTTTLEKNEDGAATVLVLAPAQTRIYGHGRSQVQSGASELGSSNVTCFREDVVSKLPFIETRVDVHGQAGDMVLTDGKRLISFVRMVSRPPPFFLSPRLCHSHCSPNMTCS
jgi:hypothetical protein